MTGIVPVTYEIQAALLDCTDPRNQEEHDISAQAEKPDCSGRVASSGHACVVVRRANATYCLAMTTDRKAWQTRG